MKIRIFQGFRWSNTIMLVNLQLTSFQRLEKFHQYNLCLLQEHFEDDYDRRV